MTEHPKEHGLLFKPDMVRAYFAGLKTMTRRVITRQNSYIDGGPAYKNLWEGLRFDRAWVDPGPSPAGNEGPYLKVRRFWRENDKVVDESVHRIYPKYQVGDTIWGKETFCPNYFDDGRPGYRADYYKEKIGSIVPEPKWTSSILMPRNLARIVTPVIAVRPERIQDISKSENADDIFKEGFSKHAFMYYDDDGGKDLDTEEALDCFRDLWNSINEKRGYGWSENPWVWAIEFKRGEGG